MSADPGAGTEPSSLVAPRAEGPSSEATSARTASGSLAPGGIVLLIAMIGAIVLTHREREGVKRQRIAAQLARDRRSVEIRKVPTGTGI